MPSTGSMANTLIHIKNKINKYIFRDQGMWRIMADPAGFVDKTGHGWCGPLQTLISVSMWWPQFLSQKESHSPTPPVRAVTVRCPHISTDDGGFSAKPQMHAGSVFLILCVSEYLNTPASSTCCELPASPAKSLNPSFITSLPTRPGEVKAQAFRQNYFCLPVRGRSNKVPLLGIFTL